MAQILAIQIHKPITFMPDFYGIRSQSVEMTSIYDTKLRDEFYIRL